MNKATKSLWSFIKLLIKRWVLLLFFYGSLIGAIFTFRILNIEVPSYVFWILALIGLFWASYKVYLEQLKKIPSVESDFEQRSELSIEFLEGNEYKYQLGKKCYLRDGQDYALKEASIELHTRISNTGTTDLDIISIEPYYPIEDSIWGISPLSIIKEKDSQRISYPRHLSVQDILLCDIKNKIEPSISLNNAQFASRLGTINKDTINIDLKIIIEARDPAGKIHKFSIPTKVSSKQLIDLYLSKWQKDNQKTLLRLARGKIVI